MALRGGRGGPALNQGQSKRFRCSVFLDLNKEKKSSGDEANIKEGGNEVEDDPNQLLCIERRVRRF